MTIIHITGVQGSGKSYICSQLSYLKILCIDTDDIMKDAINIIEKSQKTKNKIPRTFHQLQKVKSILVNNYIKENDDIIFVGITAPIPNPDYKFFIKINDFVQVFKRLLLRELDKIVEHREEIRKHIQNETDPNEIEIERIAELSLRFPVNYKDFKDDYKESLKEAKENGYKPKTQDEIVELIKKLV